MRVVVFPHSMEIGGSQLNAVEIAERMHRRGHHVVVFAPDNGKLVERVRATGMTFEPAPQHPRVRPSPSVMRALLRVVARHRIEIVHGHEWPPILEAYYGPFLRYGVVPVGTVMSMGVAPFIPPSVPLIVGTAQIEEHERRRRGVVHLIEPPVDFELNHPGLLVPDVRREAAADPDDLLVVVVGRLANELKREGLIEAVKAVGVLSHRTRMRLAIVGDGPAREELAVLASQVNAAAGRPVVTLIGAVDDPRPWYAGADLVLGMGSSALRAMAFAKPLVVQGERGFWRLLTPQSADQFLRQGWYGVGDGADGVGVLVPILEQLFRDRIQRTDLGRYALALVRSRFGLEEAADKQERIYAEALANAPRRAHAIRQTSRPARQMMVYESHRRLARLRGRASTDDFNAITAQPRPIKESS